MHIVEKVKKLMRLRAEIRAELLKQEGFPLTVTGSIDREAIEAIVSRYVLAATNLEVMETLDQIGADHT